MKKILSVLLTASVMAGMSSVYAEDTNNEAFAKNVELLTALGIDFDSSAEANDNVTRAKFVSTVLSFAGEDDGAYYAVEEEFYDVDSDYSYYDQISAGAGLGYVVGYANGYFYPESPITYQQAVKVMVNVLGYEYRAENAGGYPNGYMAAAQALGITKKIAFSGNELNHEDFAQLLINSLEVNPLKVTVSGNGGGTMSETEENALWEFHRILRVKDVVNANDVTGIKSVSDAQLEGYVLLGDESVKVGKTNANEYLGQSVTAYVHYDEDENEGEIKYIEQGTRNRVITVEADKILSDDSSFSGNNFVYEDENERSRNVRINENTSIIFNGIAKPVYSVDDLIPKAGSVTLIDNDGNGTYDCFMIFKATKTIVVDFVTSKTDKFTIVDKFDPSLSYVYESEYKYYDVQINDEIGSYSSISANMLVFVGENGEHSITRAYGESALHYGEIESVSADRITISGTEFEISPLCDKDSLSLGKAGTFWVHNGFVYGFKKGVIEIDGETVGDNKYSYGWFVNGILYDDDDTGEPGFILKVLTTENEFERFQTTDNTRYNGSKKKDKNLASAVFKKDGDWFAQVVMYSLDANGKIKEVFTTEAPNKELRFEGIYDGSWHSNSYSFYIDTWVNRYYQDEETVVFYINDTNPDESYVTGKFPSAQPINGGKYIHEFYNIDEELNTVDVVVWHKEGSSQTQEKVNTSAVPTIVKSVTQSLNEDDEPVKTIIGDRAGTTVTIEFNDKLLTSIQNEFNSIKPGDIIFYELDGMGRLSNISKSFDIDKAGQYGIATSNDNDKVHGIWNNNIHMERKIAYHKIDKKLSNNFIGYTDGEGVSCLQKIDTAAKFFRMTVKGSKVMVEAISYNDVSNGDEVFCFYRTNRLNTMIVIDVN